MYVRDPGGELRFEPLPPPTEHEVEHVARRTAERLIALLKKHGRDVDGELGALVHDDELTQEQPALAACYNAAVAGKDLLGPRSGRPTLRLVEPGKAQEKKLLGVVAGVNVHAGVSLHGADKKRLERLCRYLARPPIARERLELMSDARVRYQMKKVWSDGTVALIFEPLDLIARICAMIPPPRFNHIGQRLTGATWARISRPFMVRYHGVLAPASPLRDEVVPQRPKAQASPPPGEDPDDVVLSRHHLPGQQQLFADEEKVVRRSRRRPWAWLLRHVFEVDVTLCPQCGGRLRWLETATSTKAITRLLAAHGLGPEPPPPLPLYEPEQLELDFGA